MANHIRIFTRINETELARMIIENQLKDSHSVKYTYGHAISEFCYFRFHIKKLVTYRQNKVKQAAENTNKNLSDAILGSNDHLRSVSFYHDGSVKRDQRKKQQQLGLIEKKTKKKKAEGFNAWILASNKDA